MNATSLADEVDMLESKVSAARKLDAYRKKEVVLSIVRMHKARAIARDCIVELPRATKKYENSLISLRFARDNVTHSKRRMYRLEEKVSE